MGAVGVFLNKTTSNQLTFVDFRVEQKKISISIFKTRFDPPSSAKSSGKGKIPTQEAGSLRVKKCHVYKFPTGMSSRYLVNG